MPPGMPTGRPWVIDTPQPAADAPALPLLAFDDLHHYAWLQVPMWVFDVDRMRVCWANTAGLDFWRADQLATLAARDFSDASPATLLRLRTSMQLHADGRRLRESWTLYPMGQPLTSSLVSRGIRLADSRQAILFCSEPLAASYDADMLRGIEALQHTPVRVLLYPLDGGAAVMRNPAAVAAFGLAENNNHAPIDRLYADPSLASAVHAAVANGQGHAGEARLQTLQGPRWHAVDARTVRDPVSGTPMLLVNAQDITDLKAALVALEAARDTAETANRAKSSFLANMSHELRTPMNGVLGLTELVLAGTLDDRQRNFLQLAHQSAQSLMQIINDILDASKIEADRLTLVLDPVSLREVLARALAPMQVQARQRGLALDFDIAADLPERVVTDAQRWCQVLVNLVGNALKFTATGGIAVHLTCRHNGEHGLMLDCSVLDTGIGMSPDELKVIFEPFIQADASITRRYGGTGLGLSIARRLVQLMGGQIDVQSSPGLGSCFRFFVPVNLAEALPKPDPG